MVSHRSGASLHELLGVGGGPIDVTVPNRRKVSRPGIRIHRSTSVRARDRVVVRGIPCTSVPRTLLDLAVVVPRNVLERACDQAEVVGVLDMAAMGELLSRFRGRAGVRALRAVLGAGDLGEDIPRSELERRFLALCRKAALPSPSVNAWITVDDEEMQFDFVWHAQQVIVEVDGWATHRTRSAFRDDRRRDRLLRLAGWEAVRFTWDDVVHDAARVEREMRRLIAEAGTLTGRSGLRSC